MEKKINWLKELKHAAKELGPSLTFVDHLEVLTLAKGQKPIGSAMGMNTEKYKALSGNTLNKKLASIKRIAANVYASISSDTDQGFTKSVFSKQTTINNIVPKDDPKEELKNIQKAAKTITEMCDLIKKHYPGGISDKVNTQLEKAAEAIKE